MAKVHVSVRVSVGMYVCMHRDSKSAYLFQGKSFWFFPLPQLYQILSRFSFASGKEKGGQRRWKGLNNFLDFFFPPNIYFSSKISAKYQEGTSGV